MIRLKWPRHLNRGLLGVYLLIVFVLLTVMVRPENLPRREKAVPVFSTGPGKPVKPPGNPVFRWFGPVSLRARTLEGALEAVIPALAAAREDREETRASSRVPGYLRSLVYYLGGVDVSNPRLILGSQIPLLALVGGEGEAAEGRGWWPYAPPRRVQEGEGPLIGTPAPPTVIGAGEPLIAIYHTHAYESYVSEMKEKPVSLDFVTSLDGDRNVVRVGREMAERLALKYKIPVVQSRTQHGSFGAYMRSRKTVQSILEKYPSVKILVDVHRDSQPADVTRAVVAGRDVAKVLIVVGTGTPNLEHKNPERNLAFARDLLGRLNERFPGLARGINVQTDARYNQDLSPGAILIEIGGPENTMEEALNSARMVADVLADVVRSGAYPR